MSDTERDPLDKVLLPAGFVIHVEGLPFYLAAPTTIEGAPGNIRMVSALVDPFTQVEESATWTIGRGPLTSKSITRALNRLYFARAIDAQSIHVDTHDWAGVLNVSNAPLPTPRAAPSVAARFSFNGHRIPVYTDGKPGEIRLAWDPRKPSPAAPEPEARSVPVTHVGRAEIDGVHMPRRAGAPYREVTRDELDEHVRGMAGQQHVETTAAPRPLGFILAEALTAIRAPNTTGGLERQLRELAAEATHAGILEREAGRA